jgi:hypothetical protein
MSALNWPRRIKLPERGSPELLPALVCAVLALSAVLQLAMPPHTALSSGSLLAPRKAPPVRKIVAPNYPDILAAPLFAPDRQPSDGSDAAAFSGGMSVLGVVVGRGFASAIISGPNGIARVRPGGRIGAWTVVAISPARVVIDRLGERRALAVATKTATATEVGSDDTSSNDSGDDQ